MNYENNQDYTGNVPGDPNANDANNPWQNDAWQNNEQNNASQYNIGWQNNEKQNNASQYNIGWQNEVATPTGAPDNQIENAQGRLGPNTREGSPLQTCKIPRQICNSVIPLRISYWLTTSPNA